MSIVHKIIEKGLSGRLITTIAIIGTYCVIMVMSLGLVRDKIMSVETFITVFAVFALLAKDIVRAYFERSDRKGEANGTNN